MPSAIPAEPVNGTGLPMCGLGFRVGLIRNLSFDLNNYIQITVRLDDEVRHIGGRESFIPIRDKETQALVLHPFFHAGVCIEVLS